MKVEIEVSDYDPSRGIETEWVYEHSILVQIENGITIIKANKAGLITLARHILTLTQSGVPGGTHWHFDDYGGLEPVSMELIIERRE